MSGARTQHHTRRPLALSSLGFGIPVEDDRIFEDVGASIIRTAFFFFGGGGAGIFYRNRCQEPPKILLVSIPAPV